MGTGHHTAAGIRAHPVTGAYNMHVRGNSPLPVTAEMHSSNLGIGVHPSGSHYPSSHYEFTLF